MVRKLFLAGLVCVPLNVLCISSHAATGTGEMIVGIIDPTEMSEGEARRLCAQERQLVKCDIVFEKKRTEKAEDILPSNYSNDNFFDDSSEFSYRVFNANFE